MGAIETLLGSPLTFAIIIANVIFSLMAFSDAKLMNANLLTTQGVLGNKEYKRVVTSGFIHANEPHLFVNMLTLYFFGPIVEGGLGSVNFGIIYVISLLAGSAWALMENRRNPRYAALGASGAVSGIVLSVCLLAPTATLYLFFVIPMPVVVFAIAYLVFSAMMSGREGNAIAHEAHLGGALGGALATIAIVPQSWGNFVQALTDMLPF